MNLLKEQTVTGQSHRAGLLHKAYEIATTCAVPLVAAGLLASHRGRRRLSERFGSWKPVGGVDWWLHGASVGEVQGVLPLIQKIKQERRGEKILLTATSPTGLERGQSAVDQVRLLPIDAPFLVRRALRQVGPKRFVLSETELWPALIAETLKLGIPCHIINGRISDYTLKFYRAFNNLFAPLLSKFLSVSVADDQQRGRFISLGIDPHRIHVIGHTKYDSDPKYNGEDARRTARERFFPGISDETPILVLGSLREGEEQVWFPALKNAWSAGANLKVIIAPRHGEKFDFFWSKISEVGMTSKRWTSGEGALSTDYQVLLLDTLGVLEQAYAASDLAFVGATLVDIGGHNPFEPAMYRVPVVVGPYTSVIREPVSLMNERGGIIEVRDQRGVSEILSRLTSGDPTLNTVGQAGYAVSVGQRGACKRALEVIQQSES